MKIRTAFVSNSSTSSFRIHMDDLTLKQLKKIRSHKLKGPKDFGISCRDEDEWEIHESEEFVVGQTWMDNFSMYEFLELIGVPSDKISWGEMGDFPIPEGES